MDKETLEALIIDYIDGRLSAADRELVEQELAKNGDARKTYEELKQVIRIMETSAALEPSEKLRAGFDTNLQSVISGASGGRTVFFNPAFYRAAAAVALMVISGAIGFWISRENARDERIVQMERELAETKKLMMGMLDDDLSASQRIKGVNVAMDMTKADDEIVGALMNTMLTDPNTNVRLAALEALAKFREDPDVRRKLIGTLSRQTDPMVQITLIQLLVEMKEKEVINDLRNIVDDADAMQAVKDEAYSGILKLS